ncbi:NUDIX hydrolase [Rhodococcoides trifolii]|uniref:NUDIX hydrolase n=1 Tax=Rhodococcoides trifolii TaxID=908250 RepID=A0A917D3R1_9NOCA|nr:NUDIX domain-containing protein [Rhodococcus trifolii]GGG06079.1 NUDIX hydrolase [Rhodococcus trifolii]
MSTPVRDASTVILVRDGRSGVEVFLQRRVGGMAFAAGMTVFPGGGVDPSDATATAGWAGPAPSWWAERLSVDVPRGRALVLAAVRETFEECGVLLAGPTESTIVSDSTAFSGERRRVEARDLPFGQFLVDNDLVVRTDLLRPWANWITPEGEAARRYDTRFFVAVAPEGQVADDATSEATDAGWSTAESALADFRDGRRALMPPTWAMLRRLAHHDRVADVLADAPDLAPVQPVVVTTGEAVRVDFDGAEQYYADMPSA